MTGVYLEHWREEWMPGEQAWFEYHCNESHDSEHAMWWYHSQQQVVVLGEAANDGFGTFADRSEAAQPRLYTVRWADGFEGDVFEDELLISPAGFERPSPPPAPTIV